VDLGDIGDRTLDQVTPPETGYSPSVPAIVGHTYVSLARRGEEGHYSVFRVRSIRNDHYIEIDYWHH
jgi:hypothetical protein